MHRSALLASFAAVALVATGCQDQPTAPALAPASPVASLAQSAGGAGTLAIDLDRLTLPAGFAVSDLRGLEPGDRVIDPSDYVCTASTPISDWYVGELIDVVREDVSTYNLLYNLAADLVPTYEALYYQTDAQPQSFGYDGAYTKVLQKTGRDMRRFWDIRSDDIQVVAIHGTMLTDTARVARVYRGVFGIAPAAAATYAGFVRDAVLGSQVLDGGDHAFFSFNAAAFTTFGTSVPDKIAMGDGILEGYADLGFGDVAPQAIFAHEFAHHVQFENGYHVDPYATTGSAAERTRYKELMADALAAYYLTHARGATMNQKRVEQFLQVFFQIGDCGFTSSGHHGTPEQRLAAAQFGFRVADEAQKQGHILSSAEFYERFLAEYPTLIAPDAPDAPGAR